MAKNLSDWLWAFSQRQLTKGRLEVRDFDGRQWSLYFQLGHLIGESGGEHPLRRWRRNISQHCPQVGSDLASFWQYNTIDYPTLAKQVKLHRIRREQMIGITRAGVTELLFDLIQREALLRSSPTSERLLYSYRPEDTLYSSPLVFIAPDQAWTQAQQAWKLWQEAGLEDCSPNLAPVLVKPAELQASATVYRKLATLIDGQHSLRDLACKLKQEPSLLARSLVPFLRRGIVQLVEVADLERGESQPAVSSSLYVSTPAQPESSAPLVAYIDDSPRDSRVMEQIVTKAGYRYLSLQDPVMALPTLLESKPSLIFLDLVMPIANGYEICAQIRRTSAFKEIPVIIVTNSDGIVDRVRARIVRSTDFLAKPIDQRKVLAILRQYLPLANPLKLRLRREQNHSSDA
ncbi:MAG: response regulator [Cyanophyceae cyanobacterium]